jgi:hypothetical protein
MEDQEQRAISTAPIDCRPKFWKRYVDDIMEKVDNGMTQKLTDHMNQVDHTGSIKFTFEEEKDGSLPFLGALLVKRSDGTIKLLIYRKSTHTDQYLNWKSHHPLHHKLGVIRTLYDRNNNIVTESEDREQEEKKIEEALKKCGYPEWAFKLVKKQIAEKKEKDKVKNRDKKTEKSKGMVVIPYVKGLSEALDRVYRKYGIQSAMKPHMTLRKLLVHPKDKYELKDNSGVVYRIPCRGCDQAYIGETARKLGYRVEEHRKDVESKEDVRYTRSQRKVSEKEYNKSAITDHTTQENHVIDWNNIKIVAKESELRTRQIKEAIWIRKEKSPMNRDEGAYKLSHTYDTLLTTLPPGGAQLQ